MTTIAPRITGNAAAVKSQLRSLSDELVEQLFSSAEAATQEDLERAVWKTVRAFGAALLAALIGLRCRERTLAEIAERGLADGTWRFRFDEHYDAHLNTTFGRITVPLHARREFSTTRSVTRIPNVRDVLPLRGRCRSSTLLLSWECRAGAEAPYRRASETLRFFSDGAVHVEDTTIAAHLYKVGALVDRSWQYRQPEEIAAILRERATRDRHGRPILYLSSDACALRRFVDETTDAFWKMANGLRVWAIDRHDGSTIHLGGEYTWGDCEVVGAILEDLDKQGIVPRSGSYGTVHAQVVVITDGARWLQERVVPWFTGARMVLDAYHLLERLAADAKSMWGEGSKQAKAFLARARALVLGPQSRTSTEPNKRKGRRNKRRSQPQQLPAGPMPDGNDAERLLRLVECVSVPPGASEVRECLAAFIRRNLDRMGYRLKRWMGYQIGSGAMESLHRTAVQCRLKLPGARWLPETSARVFAMRMMALADRWDEFWSQPDLGTRLAEAFQVPAEGAA